MAPPEWGVDAGQNLELGYDIITTGLETKGSKFVERHDRRHGQRYLTGSMTESRLIFLDVNLYHRPRGSTSP